MEVKMFNRCGQSAGKASCIKKIPENIGWYLSGFADGEGSFNLSVIKRSDYRKKWKVSLSFNISQKDQTVPLLFQKTLSCGKIRYRKDGICYYEVRSIKEITEKVIPFFKRFPLKGKKQRKSFDVFFEISKIMKQKKHLHYEGMKKIIQLREEVKVGRRRKYTKNQILKTYKKNPQRLHAKPL
jgi:hypothetical protein